MSSTSRLLYHYTNQAGLIGILDRKVLWATHIHYLNDTREFWHTIEAAKNALVQRYINESDKNQKIKFKELLEDIDGLQRSMTFVTSFSARRDSLSQWRGYVGNQPGFALGFDVDALERLATSLNSRFELCIYDEKEQSEQVERIIGETLSNDFGESPYRQLSVVNGAPVLNLDFPNHFLERLLNAAPLHKHSAFIDEQEWRMIYRPEKSELPIRFRPGQSMLVPYVELSLLEHDVLSCLKEIVVGPCPHPDLAKFSLEGLVYSTKALPRTPELIVSSSTAPYRYW